MSIPLSLGLFLLCLLALGHAEETLATSRDPDHGYMVPDRVPLPTLTTVGAIRQLAAEEARRGYPVRIRGVVTLNNPYISLMFVQDESGGIYVSPEKLPWLERTGLSQGMLVQIEGRTSFGRFSPTVRGKEDAAVVVKVLGRAPLPEPLRPSIVQLADPRYQNQWIEISGVVRQVTSGSLFEGAVESVAVTVVSPAGRVTAAAFRDPPTKNLPTELVGATVRVRGVFTAILNNNDQFLGMWLATAALNDFQIVGPSPGEAFALPVRPIASLMRFDVMHSVSERVRIQGTVTQTVAGRGMYVQGETAAVYVKTIEPPQVQPGCRVDVAGFPAQGEWNPILEDAVYQTRGSGPLPEPPAITTETALSGDFDCRRVVMEGLLLQASLNPEQPTLVLQSGEKAFLARLADASDLPRLAGLAEDSWLRLEGVCVNSRREDLLKQGPLKADVRPGTFYLLVASPDGVIVLRKPSWWTTPRILAAAGGGITHGAGGAPVGHCPPLPCRGTDGDHPPATGPGDCLRGAGTYRPGVARHLGTGVGRYFAAVGYRQCEIARGAGTCASAARFGPIALAAQSRRGPPLDHGPAGLPVGRRRPGLGTCGGGSPRPRRTAGRRGGSRRRSAPPPARQDRDEPAAHRAGGARPMR